MADRQIAANDRGRRVIDDTLLLRQVHPAWVQAGRVTSQAFKPTPKDGKRLSVYDGDLISAAESWRHFTSELGFASTGVMAVTVEECKKLDLSVEPDPKPFPSHAVIKFDDCSAAEIPKKAKYLKQFAESRGWLYQTETAE